MTTKWIELAHEKRAHLFPTYWYWKMVQHVGKISGIEPGVFGCYYKNHEMSYVCQQGVLVKMGKEILRRLKEEKLIVKIIIVNETEIPKLLELSEWFKNSNLSLKSGEELYRQFVKVYEQFMKIMEYSGMGTVLEFEQPLLSNELENILKQKSNNDTLKVGEYFNILSTPDTATTPQAEEIRLRELKIKELQRILTNEEINAHTDKYSYIAFGYDGPGWSVKEVKDRLKALDNNIDKINKEISELSSAPQKIKEKQRQAENELNLSDSEKYLFSILRILGFWKFERKLANQKSHEMMEKFIEELMRRLKLSKAQAKMIAPNELKGVLLEEKVNVDLLNERIKLSFGMFSGYDNEEVIVGERATIIEKEIEKSLAVDTNITEFIGTCAFPGSACGIVKRVDDENDIDKFNTGDILVSASTTPKIIPAMKRATAIITDSGGITCHAAIISRELQVPCVVGTKIATRVLHDGYRVEVDATKGVVKIIN